jgi:hypothetical protein
MNEGNHILSSAYLETNNNTQLNSHDNSRNQNFNENLYSPKEEENNAGSHWFSNALWESIDKARKKVSIPSVSNMAKKVLLLSLPLSAKGAKENNELQENIFSSGNNQVFLQETAIYSPTFSTEPSSSLDQSFSSASGYGNRELGNPISNWTSNVTAGISQSDWAELFRKSVKCARSVKKKYPQADYITLGLEATACVIKSYPNIGRMLNTQSNPQLDFMDDPEIDNIINFLTIDINSQQAINNSIKVNNSDNLSESELDNLSNICLKNYQDQQVLSLSGISGSVAVDNTKINNTQIGFTDSNKKVVLRSSINTPSASTNQNTAPSFNINFNLMQDNFVYKLLYGDKVANNSLQALFQVGSLSLNPGKEGIKLFTNNPATNYQIKVSVVGPNNTKQMVNINKNNVEITSPNLLTLQYLTNNNISDNSADLKLEFLKLQNGEDLSFSINQYGVVDNSKYVVLEDSTISIYSFEENNSDDLRLAFKIKNKENSSSSTVQISRIKRISADKSVHLNLFLIDKTTILAIEHIEDLLTQSKSVIGGHTFSKENNDQLINQLFDEMIDINNKDVPLGIEKWINDLQDLTAGNEDSSLNALKREIISYYQDKYSNLVEMMLLEDNAIININNNRRNLVDFDNGIFTFAADKKSLIYNPQSNMKELIEQDGGKSGIAFVNYNDTWVGTMLSSANFFKVMSGVLLLWDFAILLSAMGRSNIFYKIFGVTGSVPYSSKTSTGFLVKYSLASFFHNCSLALMMTNSATLGLSFLPYKHQDSLTAIFAYGVISTLWYSGMIIEKYSCNKKENRKKLDSIYPEVSLISNLTMWMETTKDTIDGKTNDIDKIASFKKSIEDFINVHTENERNHGTHDDKHDINMQSIIDNINLISEIFKLIDDIIPQESKTIFLSNILEQYINSLETETKYRNPLLEHIIILNLFSSIKVDKCSHPFLLPKICTLMSLNKKLHGMNLFVVPMSNILQQKSQMMIIEEERDQDLAFGSDNQGHGQKNGMKHTNLNRLTIKKGKNNPIHGNNEFNDIFEEGPANTVNTDSALQPKSKKDGLNKEQKKLRMKSKNTNEIFSTLSYFIEKNRFKIKNDDLLKNLQQKITNKDFIGLYAMLETQTVLFNFDVEPKDHTQGGENSFIDAKNDQQLKMLDSLLSAIFQQCTVEFTPENKKSYDTSDYGNKMQTIINIIRSLILNPKDLGVVQRYLVSKQMQEFNLAHFSIRTPVLGYVALTSAAISIISMLNQQGAWNALLLV